MDDLGWGLILKGVVVWMGVYLLQPLLFVVRDQAISWYIGRYILNSELHMAIRKRANAVWQLRRRAAPVTIHVGPDGTRWTIEGRDVTEQEYESYNKTISAFSARADASGELIWARQFKLERLLKYYKQDMKNPIPGWQLAAYREFEGKYGSRSGFEVRFPGRSGRVRSSARRTRGRKK